VPGDALTHAQNQRSVAAHQFFERDTVPARREAREQGGVRFRSGVGSIKAP
jgi:hypothetical protein